MPNHIYIKNREQIKNGFIPENGKSILISITTPDQIHPVFNDQYISVFRLKFDDTDTDTSLKIFNDKDAKNILDFVYYHRNIDNIVINCDVGVSRSAGIGAALSYLLYGTDKPITDIKPLYNKKVYRVMINTFMKNYSI